MQKACEHCHQKFTPERSSRRFCSDKCRNQAWRASRNRAVATLETDNALLVAQVTELQKQVAEQTEQIAMLRAMIAELLERPQFTTPPHQEHHNGNNGGGDSRPVMVSGNLSQLAESGKTPPPPDANDDLLDLLEVKSVSDTPRDDGTPSAADNLIASMLRMQQTTTPSKPTQPAKQSFKNRTPELDEIIIIEAAS